MTFFQCTLIRSVSIVMRRLDGKRNLSYAQTNLFSHDAFLQLTRVTQSPDKTLYYSQIVATILKSTTRRLASIRKAVTYATARGWE